MSGFPNLYFVGTIHETSTSGQFVLKHPLAHYNIVKDQLFVKTQRENLVELHPIKRNTPLLIPVFDISQEHQIIKVISTIGELPSNTAVLQNLKLFYDKEIKSIKLNSC